MTDRELAAELRKRADAAEANAAPADVTGDTERWWLSLAADLRAVAELLEAATPAT